MSDDPLRFLRERVPSLESGDPRMRLKHLAVQDLRKTDPAAALTTVRGLGDDDFPRSVAKAFEALEVTPLPDEAVETAAENIAIRLGNYDCAVAAFDWTMRLPLPLAAQVRHKLVEYFDKTEQRKEITAWLNSAPLNTSERTALSTKASNRTTR